MLVAALAVASGMRAERTESFWEKVLRIVGVSATPRKQKGAGEKIVSGEIWIADLESHSRTRVTKSGGFRSPVFEPGREALIALSGDKLVRVALPGGESTSIADLPHAVKIVGFGSGDPDQLMALMEGADGNPKVTLLSLRTGVETAVPYNKDSDEDERLVSHLLGSERVYPAGRLFVLPRTAPGSSGMRSWTDVYLVRSGGDPIDVSNCEDVECGQPALSPDQKRVAFIKAVQ